MKCSRLFFLFLVLSLAFLIFACSPKPVDQIQKTEKAMEQAKAEHAEEFAPDEWKAGEDAWRAANAQIDQQKYGDVTATLLKAKTRFEKARDIAKGKRDEAIKEIKNTQKTAEMRCKALHDDLDKSGKKLSAAKRKEFEEACKAADEKIAKVTTQLENGQYNDAKYLAGSTLREVWEAQKELEKAIGKKTS
jgi:hypothetical protein